ncbi:hypothetical protein PMZ80_010741 [Knufia obscura]|uniref:ASX DEUBAD domain-containing protein n=1 Tax=Knufia obscura TaxID=1635080 RepID=A0ABR0R8P5_9EURO|nr:hypothetical protein PMZ80_010741 [Knufia obscura]
MSTSTKTTQTQYPARSRAEPKTTLVDTSQPMGAVVKEMANAGRTRNSRQQQQQPRRIPAFTTSRTFGEKSPIVDAKVELFQSFLAKCMSTSQWDTYTDKEKATIMDSLPATRRPQVSRSSSNPPIADTKSDYGTGMDDHLQTASGGRQEQNGVRNISPPLTPAFCSKDPYLKSSIARFKRDLGDGYYAKTWQDKAKRAHEERMDGKFDEYLREHAEEMFVEEEEPVGNAAGDELVEESEDGEYQNGSRKKGKVENRGRGE